MRLIACFTLLCLSQLSLADDDWQYAVVPYIWMPNFEAASAGDTASPPSAGNLQFESETELEMGFLVYTTARKGRHSFSFEYDWIDASTDADADFPLFPTVELDWELWVYTLGYSYQIWESDRAGDRLDLGVAVRYWDVEIDTTFEAVIGPPIEVSAEDSWTDALIEIRGRRGVGESGKWYLTGFVQAGGGDSDSVIDVAGGLGYQWSEGFQTSFGYRYLEVEFDDLELTQSGAIISLGWNF